MDSPSSPTPCHTDPDANTVADIGSFDWPQEDTHTILSSSNEDSLLHSELIKALAENMLREVPENKLLSEEAGIPATLHIKELQIAQQFIEAIQTASLNTSALHLNCLEWLQNPPQETLDIGNKSLLLLIEVYMRINHALEEVYNSFCEAVAKFPQNV